jgi:predicted alpha-1,6-mannanase (GH76 family)
VRSSDEKRAVIEEWVQTPKSFLNGFYDDEGWWGLAWLKVFDYTKNQEHIKVAEEIFDDMLGTGYNATCGGIWWNKKRMYNSAISNELFLSLAAHLANRAENKPYYLRWARTQWDWFKNSGLINANGTINDGLTDTCENNGDTIWTYNQGVVLGGLIELAKADPKNAAFFIDSAKNIAYAAKLKLTDSDGILHEKNEPDMGNDGNQFKGIFARNLRDLYDVTKEPWMRELLLANAESVWTKARNGSMNHMGPVWSGPYMKDLPATAATQSSALDVLVAAAAVA